jgi:hypothetical protein
VTNVIHPSTQNSNITPMTKHHKTLKKNSKFMNTKICIKYNALIQGHDELPQIEIFWLVITYIPPLHNENYEDISSHVISA